LSLIDVARMAFVTGLTFWLGNLFVLGTCLAYRPEVASAINLLPASINRTIGIAMLAVIALYVAWIAQRPRVVGRAGWSVTLPNTRLTLVQIAIGVLDLGLSGLALFVLLPAQNQNDIVAVIVAFVSSTLLAFASHAPGGLGVFDASMLLSLGQVGKEQLIAALLLFRLLYYIVPFGVALMLLGARELWLSACGARGWKTATRTIKAVPCSPLVPVTPPDRGKER
jgi:uncharacterized membrane protein YbhN (UPF0104 family)